MKRKITKILSVLIMTLCIGSINLCLMNVEAHVFYDFENITEEESLEFLEEHNIEVPIKYSNYENLGNLVKGNNSVSVF